MRTYIGVREIVYHSRQQNSSLTTSVLCPTLAASPHKSIRNRSILQLSPKRINQKHHLVVQFKVIFEANIEYVAMSDVITSIE
jgi:hypothetical protein